MNQRQDNWNLWSTTKAALNNFLVCSKQNLMFELLILPSVKWSECLPLVQETWVQSQVASYQRLKKMVLDTSLLNTQQYKVRIKGKVEQSWEKSSALPYTSL